ncbi:MAG TPA: hypothetical protein VF952_10435 [Chloroflexia bacterium]|jgi:hypothetical protein
MFAIFFVVVPLLMLLVLHFLVVWKRIRRMSAPSNLRWLGALSLLSGVLWTIVALAVRVMLSLCSFDCWSGTPHEALYNVTLGIFFTITLPAIEVLPYFGIANTYLYPTLLEAIFLFLVSFLLLRQRAPSGRVVKVKGRGK